MKKFLVFLMALMIGMIVVSDAYCADASSSSGDEYEFSEEELKRLALLKEISSRDAEEYKIQLIKKKYGINEGQRYIEKKEQQEAEAREIARKLAEDSGDELLSEVDLDILERIEKDAGDEEAERVRQQLIKDKRTNIYKVTFVTTMDAFMALEDGCWFCPVFKKIFDVGNALATKIYGKLRGYFLSFLAIFALGWLMFQVLKLELTLHGPNIGEFMTKMFKTLGVVLLAAAFLTPGVTVLTSYIIDVPVLFSLDLSGKILAAGGGMGKDETTIVTFPNGKKHEEVKDLCHGVREEAKDKKYENMAMSGFIHAEFSCLIRKISVRLIKGIALGVTFFALCWGRGFLGLLPDFSMLFVGLMLIIAYFSIFLKVPFRLIDLLLRLCLVVIVFPVFVVCYPFPATRGYIKGGVNMLLSTLVEMISLCVFVSLAIALLETAVQMGMQT